MIQYQYNEKMYTDHNLDRYLVAGNPPLYEYFTENGVTQSYLPL